MTAGASQLITRDKLALLVAPNGRPLAVSTPAAAPTPPAIPTEGFLCRSHGRYFMRRKIPGSVIRDALVVVVLRNKRLAKDFRDAEVEGASFDMIVAALARVRPWCCFLSSPERADVVRIGAKGQAYVMEQLSSMRERAFQRELVRRSEALAAQYQVSSDVAIYALETIGRKKPLEVIALTHAILQAIAPLQEPHEQHAAIDGLVAQL